MAPTVKCNSRSADRAALPHGSVKVGAVALALFGEVRKVRGLRKFSRDMALTRRSGGKKNVENLAALHAYLWVWIAPS